MQKIATRVFIYSSITFCVIGIIMVLTSAGPDTPDTSLTHVLIKLFFINIFIILTSFALSIAGKYLNSK